MMIDTKGEIVGYTTVKAVSLSDLNERVNEMIESKQGWQPFGSLVVVNIHAEFYIQPMAKYLVWM